jgi:hypothetical protein
MIALILVVGPTELAQAPKTIPLDASTVADLNAASTLLNAKARQCRFSEVMLGLAHIIMKGVQHV